MKRIVRSREGRRDAHWAEDLRPPLAVSPSIYRNPKFKGNRVDVDTDFIRKVLADHFDNTTLAGDPRFPGLIATILKNYFGFTDRSRLCAHTYCEVDYFRKDPADVGSHRLKS